MLRSVTKMSSEKAVDIHIRLSPRAASTMKTWMELAGFTSNSRYVEELIFAISDILELYYLNYSSTTFGSVDVHLANFTLVNSLLPVLGRLGWSRYRDKRNRELQEKMKKG